MAIILEQFAGLFCVIFGAIEIPLYMYHTYVTMMLLQKKQHTVTRDKQETELIARGRHDPCVVPRGLANDTLPYSLLIILVCLSIMRNSILTGIVCGHCQQG